MSGPASIQDGDDNEEKMMDFYSTDAAYDFAHLTPHNDAARTAFDQLVVTILKSDIDYAYSNQFIGIDGKKQTRAVSVCSVDEGADEEVDQPVAPEAMWEGKFALSLRTKEAPLRDGWWAGSEFAKAHKGQHELLLAPPTQEWYNRGIYGRHFRLWIHPRSYRVMITARHTLTLGSKTLNRSSSHTVSREALITLGACQYKFHLTDYSDEQAWKEDFYCYMHETPLLGSCRTAPRAPSVIGGIDLGKYASQSAVVAKCSHWEMRFGWHQESGDTLGIMRMLKSDVAFLNSYRQIMKSVGHHDNIVELVDVVSDNELDRLGIYFILMPLPLGSIATLRTTYEFDFDAQINLALDWTKAFIHLHCSKRITHRNINPKNLGVAEYQPARGIIQGLDRATSSSRSEDTDIGAPRYQAPEIIDIIRNPCDDPSELAPAPYSMNVDIWAFALCLYGLMYNGMPKWSSFDSTDQEREDNRAAGISDDWVTKPRWENFQQLLDRREQEAGVKEVKRYVRLLKRMTRWNEESRIGARECLEMLEDLVKVRGQGVVKLMQLKQGVKRGHDEFSDSDSNDNDGI
ncbi:MAG: hypothetical protein Q9218_004489 [Villophora microphyllina]